MPNCNQCNTGFEILAPRFYKQLELPEPSSCPTCYRKQRLAFWPYGILQKRKCDFSGETIISTYSPDAHFPVYKREHWFSDKWEAPKMNVDLNRSFFDQLYELQSKTPHFHQLGKNNVNCDYADDVWDCKNCYMSCAMAGDEDVYYVYRLINSKDCMDVTYSYDLEQCYECTYCFKCYNLKFSLDCRECSDSWFLYNCRGCKNCFMCWNLRNREYCILNKQYSKEEYEEKINSIHLNAREFLNKLRDQFEKHLKNDAVHKSTFNVNTQNSTGNYITNCKNCKNCYFLEDAEDCVHVMRGISNKTCIETSGLLRGELCSGICQSTDLHSCHFAVYCVDCSDSQYLDQCFNCTDCFGCVGLKRKKYCILNKQYKKEEYEALRAKIIEKMKKDGEYGEFFPYKFAYNGYNLSLGAFYYELSKEEVKRMGGFWEALPKNHVKGKNAKELTDLSEAISNDLVGKPFLCVKSGLPFAFIKQELDFYRRYKLPLPVLHPEERNRLRFGKLAPLDPQKTKCFGCEKEITTYYPPEWGYKKVACEDCYLKLVY
jgi:hypothetical protein